MLKPFPLSHVSRVGLRALSDLSKRHCHEAPALYEWLGNIVYAERHRRWARQRGLEIAPHVLCCPTAEWMHWTNADIGEALTHLTAATYCVDEMTARDLLDLLNLWIVALASSCLNQHQPTLNTEPTPCLS